MTNYYDGARAEEARKLHDATTGRLRVVSVGPFSSVEADSSPTLGELLGAFDRAYDLHFTGEEIVQLAEEIKRRIFGPYSEGVETVDVEVIDDDR